MRGDRHLPEPLPGGFHISVENFQGAADSIAARILSQRTKATAKRKMLQMRESYVSKEVPGEAVIHVMAPPGSAPSDDVDSKVGGETDLATEEEMFADLRGPTLCFIRWPERLEQMYQDELTVTRMLGTAAIVIMLSADPVVRFISKGGIDIFQWPSLVLNLTIAVTCLCMPKKWHHMMRSSNAPTDHSYCLRCSEFGLESYLTPRMGCSQASSVALLALCVRNLFSPRHTLLPGACSLCIVQVTLPGVAFTKCGK